MSQICQSCGFKYKVDLLIPDRLWQLIKPENENSKEGLLCGSCIMKRIEEIEDQNNLFLKEHPCTCGKDCE